MRLFVYVHAYIGVCNAPFYGSSGLCEQRQKPKCLNAVPTSGRYFLTASSCSLSAAKLQAVDSSLSADPIIDKISARNGEEQIASRREEDVMRQPAHGAEVKAAVSSSGVQMMIEEGRILITKEADGAEKRQAGKKKRAGEERRGVGEGGGGGEATTVECVTSRNTKLVQERLFQNNVLAMQQPPFLSYKATAKNGTRRCKKTRASGGTH